MHGYDKHSEAVYLNDDFMEFEVTTLSVLRKNIPISGGGYLRIFTWFLMKKLVSQHLKTKNIYVLYIHPFELSKLEIPPMPRSTSTLTKFRYTYGRNKVQEKIIRLVNLLEDNGYSFTTFSEIQKEISRASHG